MVGNPYIHYRNFMQHGTRFVVFFSDFAADIGLNYLLRYRRLAASSFRNTRSVVNKSNAMKGEVDSKTQQRVMPVYESINYFLALNKTHPENKVIILTENYNPHMLKLFASFKIFDLLSKKESPNFIYRVVIDPVDVINQHISPDIVETIGEWKDQKSLSQREWFVLSHLARNLTPAVISRISGLNVKTISTYKISAMKKLGLTPSQFLHLLMMLGEVTTISTIVIESSSNQYLQ